MADNYRLLDWKVPIGDSNDDYEHESVDLAAIGTMNVGKTCFLFRIIENQYNDKRVATISVDYKKKYIFSSHPDYTRPTRVLLKDTIGEDRYWIACAPHFRNVAGVFVCFDATDQDSYGKCARFLELFRKENSYAACMLVGLKADAYESLPEVRKWMKDRDMVAAAAEQGYSAGFCLVSSKMNTNVAQAVVRLVDCAIKAEKDLVESVDRERGNVGTVVDIAKVPKDQNSQKSGCCGK